MTIINGIPLEDGVDEPNQIERDIDMNHLEPLQNMMKQCFGDNTPERKKAVADALEALHEPHAIKRLHFIAAPRNGVCERTGADIRYGEPCIERVQNNGSKAWFSRDSAMFKWWVEKHTKLTQEQAHKGLCNHGLLADCKECREITPGWTEAPKE